MTVLVPGDVIAGRFRIEGFVGKGGMGTVYRAAHLDLARDVALKLISAEYSQQRNARARFEREARVAAALKHPSAIQIYDFGEHDGQLYIAMELLDGRPLDVVLDESPGLAISQVIEIGAQAAELLAAAHDIQLIHRDIKPENMFLEAEGGPMRVRVLDFGLAFIQDREDAGRMTREGLVAGTPHYMSPEQARGDASLGAPTDVYALGCVLYEMLSGSPPFDADASAVLLAKHLFVEPDSLRDLLGGAAPLALCDLVTSMLSKAAEDRPSASMAAQALRVIDLDADGRLGEGRSGISRTARGSRMVTPHSVPASSGSRPPPGNTPRVGTTVRLDADMRLTLATSGFEVKPLAEMKTADVILAPGATLSEVRALAGTGIPVVSDLAPAEFVRLTGLLEAGAADVLVRPYKLERVGVQLRRVVRRNRSVAS